MREEPELTAAELVVTVPQPDDSGADTADRYDWQAGMASADGLRLYHSSLGAGGRPTAGDLRRILCEYHEDWVVLQGSEAELVSGKHRDPNVGPFTTINQLADEGGLSHLFLRWVALREKPYCRLATTNGLAAGEPKKLESAIFEFSASRAANQPIVVSDKHSPYVNKLHLAIRKYGAKHLPGSWTGKADVNLSEEEQRTQVARFLSILTIQVAGIDREHLQYAAPSMYAKPVLEQLGIDVSPEAAWNAIHSIFRLRMRAAGPRPDGALPPVLSLTEDARIALSGEKALVARIVTVQDIHTAVFIAANHPSAYGSLPSPLHTSRAAVKMRRGGCSDNSIERSEQLRRDYSKYWSKRMSGDHTALAEKERLRRLLLSISDQADTPELRSDERWGAKYWREIQRLIAELPPESIPPGLDKDLLLGGISELTNACQIWFSEWFDVEEEIDRMRERSRGGAR
ncbi:hypothetical protein [Streptomyces tanashiensis]|uniref:hypothetical protein n=1 Tax=Streptomyces tanashiensis TaxID=67367 RepID=UPI0034441428